MYAHQVVEDLKRLAVRGKEIAVNYIKRAKMYHVGRTSTLSLATKLLVGKRLFVDHSEYCALPSKVCWFDYVADDDLNQFTARHSITKRGILCVEWAKGLIHASIFFCHQTSGWILSPVTWVISVNKDLIEYRDDLRRVFGWDIVNDLGMTNGNIIRLPSFVPDHVTRLDSSILADSLARVPQLDQITHDDTYELMILQATLMLLHCRNVVTVHHESPAELNKKRREKGKQELFPYRTIEIQLPSKRHFPGQSSEGPENRNMRRAHLCRGHFKFFTVGAPLFGKRTGIFWWQPHLRGSGLNPLLRGHKMKKNSTETGD